MKDDTKTDWRMRVEKALIKLLDSIGSTFTFEEAVDGKLASRFGLDS